jgi:Fur family ferric uptake transcriptional regulator
VVDASAHIDDVLSIVRAGGGRVTATKRLLLGVLTASDDHLTADEITARVRLVAPDTSASTIYRNLEEFEELGVLVHSHMGRAAAVYHLAGTAHGHLLCEQCGATIEVPAAEFEALVRTLQRKFDFAVDRHHLALSGSCAICSRKK